MGLIILRSRPIQRNPPHPFSRFSDVCANTDTLVDGRGDLEFHIRCRIVSRRVEHKDTPSGRLVSLYSRTLLSGECLLDQTIGGIRGE